MTSIKTILAAVVVLGSLSFAHANTQKHHQLQSREVSLPQQRETGPANSELWMDRASQTFSGGGY